jgi:hypothetical protein
MFLFDVHLQIYPLISTAYRVYQTTDSTFAQAGNSDPSQFSTYSPTATSIDTTGFVDDVAKLTVAVSV